MRQILRARMLATNSIANSSCSNSSCSSGGDYAVEYGCSLALLPSYYSGTGRLSDAPQAEGVDLI